MTERTEDYQYSGSMIDDLLSVKRRSIELYDKATLAFHNQGSEFRAQQVLDAIARLRMSMTLFENAVRRREADLAEDMELEAAE